MSRPRIKYVSLATKIWLNKQKLAQSIVNETNCTFGKALKQVEFNLAFARI